MDSQSAALLRRLNTFCAQALEAAASLCQTRAHAEIQPEHWLLKLLEQGEGDITVIARRYEWDMDAIWQDLLVFLDRQPRAVRGRPQLSSSLEALLKQAWLMASASDNSPQIRSIHLLMALSEQPKLAQCEGLWPLLSLRMSQLERLQPMLEAQSDERAEAEQPEMPVSSLEQTAAGETRTPLHRSPDPFHPRRHRRCAQR